jgi:hypothetical protein
MNKKKMLIGIAAVALLALMVSSVSAECCYGGLTPGFWKNNAINWGASWWVGATPSTTLAGYGFVTNKVPGSTTFLEALQFGGGPGLAGAERILLRAAVAGILNNNSPEIAYPLWDYEIVDLVNAAIATEDRGEMLSLAFTLDGYNNLGGSLPMPGP